MTVVQQGVKAEFWTNKSEVGQLAYVEVERAEDEPDRIAISTYVEESGSVASFYLDRDSAIRYAHALLAAALLR